MGKVRDEGKRKRERKGIYLEEMMSSTTCIYTRRSSLSSSFRGCLFFLLLSFPHPRQLMTTTLTTSEWLREEVVTALAPTPRSPHPSCIPVRL